MQIIRIDGQLGAYSWATGFKPTPKRQLPLDEEAKKNPEAVIFRLLREDREDEAERFFELYV